MTPPTRAAEPTRPGPEATATVEATAAVEATAKAVAVVAAAEAARGFRSFLLIRAAQLVARVGNGLTPFGLSVYVYQLALVISRRKGMRTMEAHQERRVRDTSGVGS